jgi:hypothetical protein
MKTYRCYVCVDQVEADSKKEAEDKFRNTIRTQAVVQTAPLYADMAMIVKRHRTKGE